MASSTKVDLLAGKVASFAEFFAGETLPESLDFNMFLDGISSIPYYERLGINKELLSTDELDQMKTQAMAYLKIYQDRLKIKFGSEDTNVMESPVIEKETKEEKRLEALENPSHQNLRNGIGDDNEDKGRAEQFLKLLYNTEENNLLITTLLKNINFDAHPEPLEDSLQENYTNLNLKGMESYFNDISNGKYDDFAFRHPSPIPSSSESESDQEVSSKAREFSAKFKISTNAYKYDFLKSIVDESLKKSDYIPPVEKERLHFHPSKWISSDDSEEEITSHNEKDSKRKKKKATKSRNKTLSHFKQSDTTQQKQKTKFGSPIPLSYSSPEHNKIDSLPQQFSKNRNQATLHQSNVTESSSNKAFFEDRSKQLSTGTDVGQRKKSFKKSSKEKEQLGFPFHEKQIEETNEATPSRNVKDCSSTSNTRADEINKGDKSFKPSEEKLPHFNQSQSTSQVSHKLPKTNKSDVNKRNIQQEKLDGVSNSSDEDWAMLAEKGLSAVVKIMKPSSKKP